MNVAAQYGLPLSPAPLPAQPQRSSAAYQVELVRRLVSTMMVGQMHAQFDDVAYLFRTLSTMLGDNRHLRITLALASAIGGETQPARELLTEGMDDWPGAESAKISVALALKIAGDPEWIRLCEETLAVSNDGDARRFARQLLDQADSRT
ncbi:HrpB1 family type III secretion system apparatus protein [Variovorax sp. 770b2]|uniref:HrpB1 family type III secretion system apparatus protein n=1 Tax=Variovorax sp. 770b2 TaxID=1566271 RepID=UPI0008F167F7|nr:HrpB1 family type III secretion system apparatus protein [Variovorax sp. 770b2]SFQ04355.1 hypothetical protein SAMN03159339_5278 [Variovorax sp. 770b2]